MIIENYDIPELIKCIKCGGNYKLTQHLDTYEYMLFGKTDPLHVTSMCIYYKCDTCNEMMTTPESDDIWRRRIESAYIKELNNYEE
jgi:hypothetical protein